MNALWPLVFEAMRDKFTTYSDELHVASQSEQDTAASIWSRVSPIQRHIMQTREGSGHSQPPVSAHFALYGRARIITTPVSGTSKRASWI